MTRRSAILVVLITSMVPAFAAEPPAWEAVATELLKSEKPGYGGLCGVLVDPQTGDLYVNLSDKGVYVSADQGQSFKNPGAASIKGRTETPGCLLIDPTGKSRRMVMALVYGDPIRVSPNQLAAVWDKMHAKSGHVDWCAVDWSDPEMKFILTLKHESGDLLLASHDGGKSFSDVGKGYGPAWIFDSKTAVVAQAKSKDNPKPGLLRTTDAAKTFQPAGDYHARALPKWRDGALYWLVDGALIRTADQGQTWQKVSDLKDGRYGPIFGKDSKHLFVLTGGGIIESQDGGASWSAPIAPPKEMKGLSTLTWFDYDARRDTLYLMKMTSDLYRLKRKS